jgi:hypothetical protein
MSKWCDNSIKVIKGKAKEIFGFVRSDESPLDFNQLIPMPEDIKQASADVSDQWCAENWGTENNAAGARYSDDHANVILFSTAEAPPEQVFEALAKQFPTHDFLMLSDEHEYLANEYAYKTHWHHTFTAEDGQLKRKKDACNFRLLGVSIICSAISGVESPKWPLSLLDALAVAERIAAENLVNVSVDRIGRCWPPEFAITIASHGLERPFTFRGFSSRAAAWDAVEAGSTFKTSTPNPDQDEVDNARFPWDVDCGPVNECAGNA